MNTFFSPMYHGNHWLWNGGHCGLGPQIKFNWIQPGKHWGLFFKSIVDFLIGELKKSNTYIGKSWFTLNLIAGIFAEPRRLFFMTAFSRGADQHFSHIFFNGTYFSHKVDLGILLMSLICVWYMRIIPPTPAFAVAEAAPRPQSLALPISSHCSARPVFAAFLRHMFF